MEPPCRLSPEEQRSLINFAERLQQLSPERQVELADLLQPLTGKTGETGLQRLLGMANYLAGQR